MDTFLSKIIKSVLSNHDKPIEKLIFVLPSERSCVFLKSELVRQLDKVTFLPKIISIEHYIQELSDKNQVDSIQLLFEFYTVYLNNTEKKQQDSFDVFSQWATILLQDFNEVDRNLIDTKDLFTYLRDINRLENWSPTTKLTKNYFLFFEKLALYYDEFYKFLCSNDIGYQGLIYREAKNNIQQYIKNNLDKHIVLCGFNALNKAEEHIFQELLQSGIASVYWDADKSYFNKQNEVGTFLRKYKREWNYFDKNPFNWIENYLDDDSKKIKFIGAPKNVNQLKYVGELLEKQQSHQKTALVLADESLLSLTLNSLPKEVSKINITMGFPLKDISLSSFFKIIFDLYLHQIKFNLIVKNEFYYKDILSLLNHPYLKKLMNQEPFSITNAIGKSNRIFFSEKQIEALFGKKKSESYSQIKFLFTSNKVGVNEVISNCIQLCLNFKDIVEGIEKEYVYRFFTVFQQLKTLNERYGYLSDLKTLYQFYSQILNSESLSFKGEPL